jgi:hypothetical protein
MKTGSGTVAVCLALLLLGSATAQQTTPPAAATDKPAANTTSQSLSPGSQVRIVRLSEVSGQVEVDRNVGNGFETALLNLPITEGSKLRTAAGFAEVEFEDGSTLRLTPFSAVKFQDLRRESSGSTVSVIHVHTGMVYVSLGRTKSNEFTLSFADQNVQLMPSSHVRLFLKGQWVSVDVLHGKVMAETPTGVKAVSKRTINFHLVDPVEVSENANAAAPYDGWDKEAIDYHNRYAKTQAYGSSGSTYGIADMSYYGQFLNLGACGVMWRPYFAGAAWDPFATGSWVWYPAWGYAWVSPYPWGWTAYHYGQWEYCPNYGWGWLPLPGQFRILPEFGKLPPGYRIPEPPPRPRPRAAQIVTVNSSRAIRSEISNTGLLFRRDSAGLGVPRGFRSLNHASERAQQQGSSTMAVKFPPMVVVSELGHNSPTAGRSGGSVAYLGTHSSYFGKPGSYSGGRSSYGYSGGGYPGGHSGGYSASGGHSSGGSTGGGGGGHTGK